MLGQGKAHLARADAINLQAQLEQFGSPGKVTTEISEQLHSVSARASDLLDSSNDPSEAEPLRSDLASLQQGVLAELDSVQGIKRLTAKQLADMPKQILAANLQLAFGNNMITIPAESEIEVKGISGTHIEWTCNGVSMFIGQEHFPSVGALVKDVEPAE